MKAPKRSLATVSAQVEALTADQPKMWSQVTAMTATLASMQATLAQIAGQPPAGPPPHPLASGAGTGASLFGLGVVAAPLTKPPGPPPPPFSLGMSPLLGGVGAAGGLVKKAAAAAGVGPRAELGRAKALAALPGGPPPPPPGLGEDLVDPMGLFQAVGPEQVMMQTLASNTKALTMLLEGQGDKKKKKEKKDRGIDESSSDGSDSSGSDEGGRLRGSSSALGMSRLRTWVSKKPLRVRRLLLRRLSSLLGVKPSEFRARSYLETFACFKDHKTLAMLEWMLGGIIDSFMAGRQDQGFAELLLLFVSIEQTCIDGGKWQNSFLLSCSREVPWGLLLREETPQAASGEKRKWSPAIPEGWIAAISGWRKDQDRLSKRAGGKGRRRPRARGEEGDPGCLPGPRGFPLGRVRVSDAAGARRRNI